MKHSLKLYDWVVHENTHNVFMIIAIWKWQDGLIVLRDDCCDSGDVEAIDECRLATEQEIADEIKRRDKEGIISHLEYPKKKEKEKYLQKPYIQRIIMYMEKEKINAESVIQKLNDIDSDSVTYSDICRYEEYNERVKNLEQMIKNFDAGKWTLLID